MNKLFLILAVVICLGSSVNAQTEHDLKTSDFLLLIENTEMGIKLTGVNGCAFKELAFSLEEGQTQEIDQYGMKNANEEAVKDDNLASFRFTIRKTGNGLALEGIEGTAWTELSFSMTENGQLIDQNGMK